MLGMNCARSALVDLKACALGIQTLFIYVKRATRKIVQNQNNRVEAPGNNLNFPFIQKK